MHCCSMSNLILVLITLHLTTVLLPSSSALPASKSSKSARLLFPHNMMRSAPQMCPIGDGNLIRVDMFVVNVDHCIDLCQATHDCRFYAFYQAIDNDVDEESDQRPMLRPSQCYLFASCGRDVVQETCALNEENTLEVRPFIKSSEQCRSLCQENRKCGYFKYFGRPSSESSLSDSTSSSDTTSSDMDVLESSEALLPETRVSTRMRVLQFSLSFLEEQQFCFLLESCSQRLVQNVACAMGRNNFLDVKLFVQTLDACRAHCEEVEGCRYYNWHSIEDSSAPLYCFLFRQCADNDQEPEVALVLGGRHPGKYFLGRDQRSDLIMRNDVCLIDSEINEEDTNELNERALMRAGAVAVYVGDRRVIMCGGRDADDLARDDCVLFNTLDATWTHHSSLNRRREEASMAMVDNGLVVVVGGINESSVEILDLRQDRESTQWNVTQTDMPMPLARGCLVAVDEHTVLLIGGHDNTSTDALSKGFALNTETMEWTTLPDMIEARRDHACLYTQFEEAQGVLVTGGLGLDGSVLASSEFLSLPALVWTSTASLQQARMEHAMSLVYGIPTVIGGLREDGFLSKLEQFDKTSDPSVTLGRSWSMINHELNTPRYQMAVANIPVSDIDLCDADIV